MNLHETILLLILFPLISFVSYKAGYNVAYNEHKPSEERKLFVTSGDRCFSLDENLSAKEINCKDDKDDRRNQTTRP